MTVFAGRSECSPDERSDIREPAPKFVSRMSLCSSGPRSRSPRYFGKAARPSLFGQNPDVIYGCFLSLSNATREATVKSGILISFAAALALLISFSSGADAVGVGKQCDGFVIHPQHCNHGL